MNDNQGETIEEELKAIDDMIKKIKESYGLKEEDHK
jgi:predicted RNase H-like HicB family nuclease